MRFLKALPVALLVVIPSYVLVQDHRSARYGNGVFTHYSELALGAYLTNINGSMITHGKSNDYMAIVWPGVELVSSEGDTIRVNKVTGYAIEPSGLYVAVQSPMPDTLAFTSRAAIQGSIPTFMHSVPPLKWFDLESKPALVYYWRIIVIMLLLLEVAVGVWVVGRFFKSK